MMQSEGFLEKDKHRKFCLLQRSIYGTKQASRSWNIKFDQAIYSYSQVLDKSCVCQKKK